MFDESCEKYFYITGNIILSNSYGLDTEKKIIFYFSLLFHFLGKLDKEDPVNN